MSVGLVYCSGCRREAHQSGPREVENGWQHDDGTPRCAGATTEYVRKLDDVAGGVRCELYDARIGGRCERRAVKCVPNGIDAYGSAWICEQSHKPAQRACMLGADGRRMGGSGNLRNGPCPCGSGKKAKRCCG